MIENKLLEEYIDKQQIVEVLMKYCRAIDRQDWDLLESVYHPGAGDDHGVYRGPAEGFIDFCREFLSTMEVTSHNITNYQIELVGDNKAFSESYVIAYHFYEEEGKPVEMIFGGRYLDQFEKRNDEWRIADRKLVADWNNYKPSTAIWEGPKGGELRPRARSDKEDISYIERLKAIA